jgi:hypothetical protein
MLAAVLIVHALWKLVIRPLGSIIFSGSIGNSTMPGTAVGPDGKAPAEWGARIHRKK